MSSEELATKAEEETDVVVKIRDLLKEYGDITAVNGVDLDIKEQEFFIILGPSGSGKSTLMQMITGIEVPTSGDIYISDELVNDVKPYNRDTSLIFQEYALFPHLTARENIEYGLKVRGVDEDERQRRSNEMFELMDLTGKEDRQTTDLSGGERQRVATARSLVVEPKVLLLDEVLGSLDEKLAKEMQVELKRLQKEIEKTFVFVTHSQEEALSMGDRIAIMDKGNIQQVGEPLEVYQNPSNEFVADFLGMQNILHGSVSEVLDGRAKIRNNDTEFLVDLHGESVEEGEEVGFFVPNEQMVIAEEADNQLTGTIIDTIFKGSSTEYAVRIDGVEEELRVHESTKNTLHEEGSDITIGFDSTDAKLIS